MSDRFDARTLSRTRAARGETAGQAAGSQSSVAGVRRGVLYQVPPPTRGKSAGQEGCASRSWFLSQPPYNVVDTGLDTKRPARCRGGHAEGEVGHGRERG